jgi:hypothetical protein
MVSSPDERGAVSLESEQTLEEAKMAFEQTFTDDPEKLANIYFRMAKVFTWQREYLQAANLYKRASDLYGSANPPAMESALKAQLMRGTVLSLSGDSREAADILEETWHALRFELGEQHELTVTAANQLAWSYLQMGETEKAQDPALKAMDARRQIEDEDSVDLAWSEIAFAESIGSFTTLHDTDAAVISEGILILRSVIARHEDGARGGDRFQRSLVLRAEMTHAQMAFWFAPWEDLPSLLADAAKCEEYYSNVNGEESPQRFKAMGNRIMIEFWPAYLRSIPGETVLTSLQLMRYRGEPYVLSERDKKLLIQGIEMLGEKEYTAAAIRLESQLAFALLLTDDGKEEGYRRLANAAQKALSAPSDLSYADRRTRELEVALEEAEYQLSKIPRGPDVVDQNPLHGLFHFGTLAQDSKSTPDIQTAPTPTLEELPAFDTPLAPGDIGRIQDFVFAAYESDSRDPEYRSRMSALVDATFLYLHKLEHPQTDPLLSQSPLAQRMGISFLNKANYVMEWALFFQQSTPFSTTDHPPRGVPIAPSVQWLLDHHIPRHTRRAEAPRLESMLATDGLDEHERFETLLSLSLIAHLDGDIERAADRIQEAHAMAVEFDDPEMLRMFKADSPIIHRLSLMHQSYGYGQYRVSPGKPGTFSVIQSE